MTIKQLTNALQKEFGNKKFASTVPNRRNKRVADGWACPGNGKWTRAVKAAGLPWDKYWSGANPTPSTQYPQETPIFLV